MSRLKHVSNTKHLRYDEAVDYDSESDCSDEFDSDSEPSIRPSFKGTSRPPRFRAPIGAPRHSRFHEPMDFMSSTTNSSVLSSLDTTEGTTETDPSDLYTPIDRKRAPMMMDEEISPVLSETSEPLPPRLRLHREWNPQHTSTTSNMKPLFKLPKTNPHLTSSTPVRSRAPVLTTYNQVIAMPQTSRPASYYDIENDPNLVWDNRRPASSSRLTEGYSNGYYKPDHFKIPAVLARNKGISGILFLTMTIGGTILSVNVRNAFYFSEPRQSRYSSYIKLEMKNRLRKRQTSHSSRSSRHHHNEPNSHPTSVRTSIVHSTNKPDFRATFTFQLDLGRERNHQELFIRVYAVESGNSKKMLGCMTFPISRMLEKASRDQRSAYYKDESTVEEVVVNDEGFFLMDAKHGEKNNLPQHKVRLTEFYDDPALSGSCGMTTSSYSSSNLTSSRQMPMEEFVAASRQFGSSMIPGYSANVDVPLDNSSASSSSSYPHYNGRHRFTLPNIVTTSDSSEAYSGVSCQQIQETEHHLYAADNNMNERKFRRGGSPSPTPNAKHVRRATSFTFSPKDSVAKYNQRAPQAKAEKTEESKKKTGPLAKMFSLLRNNKKDSSLSSSSLFLSEKHRLSNEEVAEWEHNFEKLLLHEVGNQLFRKFLEKEHSEENLDFWTACEEFKKMKDGESKTIKMAHEIFETYIREKADKQDDWNTPHDARTSQVNLDSDTRAATKAALESGAHVNCFQLAQTQIELLMKTDTYKRFLQDALFLDFKVRLSEHQRPTSTPNEA